MLERNHLTIIQTIEQLGTLTEAASKLCLTQSALSHSIKKLEQQLGVAIWIKDGRRLRLTQVGRAVLHLADRVLPQFAHSEQLIAKMAEGSQGSLRIGMECHPCYQWLLNIVGPFLKQFPKVDLDVCQRFQFGGVGALLGFDIDVLVTPDPLYVTGLEYLPVFDYEHVLVVNIEHPLAAKNYVEPQDLSSENVITYPVEPSRLDIFSQFCTPAGVAVKKHTQIETTEILLQMVASGRGVAALPRWLVEDKQQALGIVPLKLGKKGIFKTINLGFRVNETRPAYLHHFIQMAQGSAVISK
ncbi:LysR family transcriptional regulator [Paraglaciecola sp.]|uniref:LysR family transcriptional regulator n=1 Tax=Paraglaciecola sp. TaxID=1920173 RepID=UPI0030F3A5ED